MDDKVIFRKKVIKSLVVTAAILVAELAIIIILFNWVKREAARVTAQKQLLITFQKERLSFENLDRGYKKISPYLATLDQALPSAEDLIRVIEAMENAGLKAGNPVSLSLGSQTPLQSSISGVNYVPFSIYLNTNYAGLRNYLKALDALPIFLEINGIGITGSSLHAISTIQLTGKIYTK